MNSNSSNFCFAGGNFEMLSIKKCPSCGVMCDSAFIYWNPILQKETCYFERLKLKKQNKLEVKNEE
jgi:hypothetical protein